jgi:hypothetical protein
MSGRDCIGIAKTGSGKTLAFVLPMMRHVKDQPPLADGDGPVALGMAPTRELVTQIGREVKRFARVVGLTCVTIYGGSGVANQITELKRGTEIVICTPGRMIDVLGECGGSAVRCGAAQWGSLCWVGVVVHSMVGGWVPVAGWLLACWLGCWLGGGRSLYGHQALMLSCFTSHLPLGSCPPAPCPAVTSGGKITNLRRVTYLVLDEADRMFDMGFEPQITRIVGNVRPDRQTVMFSATFPRQVGGWLICTGCKAVWGCLRALYLSLPHPPKTCPCCPAALIPYTPPCACRPCSPPRLAPFLSPAPQVEVLARQVLTNPVEIQVGGRSVVNKDITQFVEIRPEEDRFLRLLEVLGEW